MLCSGRYLADDERAATERSLPAHAFCRPRGSDCFVCRSAERVVRAQQLVHRSDAGQSGSVSVREDARVQHIPVAAALSKERKDPFSFAEQTRMKHLGHVDGCVLQQ